MSTTSKFEVPSISILPDISNSVATILLLNVAAPASDISRVRAVIVEPPSSPLKTMSASLMLE